MRGLLFPEQNQASTYLEFMTKVLQTRAWMSFLQDSGLFPFICYHLKKVYRYANPIIHNGIGGYYATIGKAMMMDRIVIDLMSLFRDEKMVMVLTKGYILSRDYYCHIGCRPYGDLDIWIEARYHEKAYHLMIENGWDFQGRSPILWNEHYTFNHPFYRQTVELHWQLTGLYGASPFLLLDSQKIKKKYLLETMIDTHCAWTFVPEVHYIHGMINWVKKGGWPPIKYLDLYFLYRHCRPEYMNELARVPGLKRLMVYLKREIDYYFGSSDLQIKKPAVLSVVKSFHVPQSRDYFLLRYYLLSDWLIRAEYCRRLLFPSPEFFRQYYGKNQSYLGMIGKWWKEKISKFFHRFGKKNGVSVRTR